MEKEIKIIDENGEVKVFNSLKELNEYYSPTPKVERKQRTKSVGNGSGSFYYSKAKKKWLFSYHDPSGKRKTIEQKNKETKTEFEKRVIDLKASLNNGSYIASSSESIESILTAYFKQKWEDGQIRPVTKIRHEETLKQISKCCNNFYSIPIQKVTINMITNSKEEMRKYSNSTIGKMWSAITLAFRIASSRRIILFNIMDDVSLTKPISAKPTKKIEALTVTEEQKLRNVLTSNTENPLYCNVCLLQLQTGMRIGEVLSLKLDDINLKEKTITVHSTITIDEKAHWVYQQYTKTHKNLSENDFGNRTIPMTDMTYSLIRKIIKNMVPNINKFLFYDNGFLNRQKINSWLERINFKYRIIDVTAHPNDQSLHSHALRHTFATRMNEKGVPETVQQAILGHAPGSKITQKHYISVSLDFMKASMSEMQ